MTTTVHKFLYLCAARRRLWADRKALAQWQQSHLKKIVQDAAQLPFYRNFWQGAGVSLDEAAAGDCFEKLPVLSKALVREGARNKTLYASRYLRGCVARTTSGSSGFPLTVYYDRKSYTFSEAIYARALFEQGVRLTDRMAYFWHEPFRQRGFWEHLGLMRKNEILTTAEDSAQLAQLRALRPTVIHCFPSTLYLLCQLMRKKKISLPVRLVITHGELLMDSVRRYIEETLQAPVLDQYGSNEFNRMAWQCKEYKQYHIDADNIYLEILDDQGNEVAEGQRGRLVVTHLVNRMMPLVRYDIGDFAVKTSAVCACGRVLPLLEKLEGRKDDFIVRADGSLLSPRRIGGALESITSLSWYHLTQHTVADFTLEVAPNDSFSEAEARRIDQLLLGILGVRVKLIQVKTDALPRNPRGKMRAIESQCRQQQTAGSPPL